jgi:hypothetical protein
MDIDIGGQSPPHANVSKGKKVFVSGGYELGLLSYMSCVGYELGLLSYMSCVIDKVGAACTRVSRLWGREKVKGD